jgi:cytochrome c
MNSFELNKIMGAVLGTLLFIMAIGFVAEAVYHPIQGQGPGYALPEPEAVASAGPAEAAPPAVPLGVLLASADIDRGASAARKCMACHTFGEGEPNKQGPHLYDVVGRAEGSVADFSYSDALKAHHDAGDTWTYENLNHFLTKPADYAPGTKMAFAGIRSDQERADLLAYLQTLSANPVPFPEAEEAPAEAAPAAEDEAEAAPAEAATEAPEEAEPAPEAAAEPEAEPAAEPEAEPAPAATEDEAAAETDEAAAEAAPADDAFGLRLANASAERGASSARKCLACHTFGEGEPNKQGPHLYDVVGRAEGSVPDYKYSDALLAHFEAGDTWTYENLDHFLTRPADYAPGTKMAFAGIRSEDERADLLAYLQTLSANPVPFPGQ